MNMWEKTKGISELFSFHLSLKSRVYLVNAVLLGITLVGAVLMVWYTYKIENVFKTIISRNVVIFESAEALGTDLINQKGYVTYFFQDGNPEWLVELARYRTRFENTLEELKTQIMDPIRKLILQVDTEEGTGKPRDEVDALQRGVLGLLEDAEETHQKLRQSQVSLLQSEKMALIGRLAAGTAHSIRNPLTSVKMRLFSLNRSAALSNTQREDLNVISGEIIQINKIVENFLEFARPPKLIMKRMSPSTAVDSAVYLLDQRLRSYHVNLKIERSGPLSETLIDPEQLKEVLVNIIINACEAMKKGGSIMIREEEMEIAPLQKADVIRISDNGEGIAEEIMKNIFDPFFTTKEEGTGLGLSIAYNIIHEHGGTLEASSQKGKGTDFTITLPIREKGPIG